MTEDVKSLQLQVSLAASIVELRQRLAALRTEVADLKNANRTLQAEVAAMKTWPQDPL